MKTKKSRHYFVTSPVTARGKLVNMNLASDGEKLVPLV